jgi:O-acetyl-ADP-ribose deacetylase (regulator of RNase III)
MKGGLRVSRNNIFRPLEYVTDNSTLRVEYSDLSGLNADVLVSSDDIDLSMGGGVSRALLMAGGREIWNETRQWAPTELGNVAITTAGRLKAKRIFHAAVLDYNRRDLTTIDLIRKVTKKCLVLCDQLGFRSIAFPALATGTARLSPERSAVAMLIEMCGYISQSTSVKQITIALYSRTHLPENVLPQFYAKVSDFLEMTQRLNSIAAALDHLERVYHTLSLDKAAESTALYRENIRRRRAGWEREMLQREPEEYGHRYTWDEYSEEIEPDLRSISSLDKHKEELKEIIINRENTQTWEKLESEYKEYRGTAVRQMIIIRKRNITDLELELANQGFSIEINRQLEYQRKELNRLENELQELK